MEQPLATRDCLYLHFPSADGWISTVGHPFQGTLLVLEKEGNSDTPTTWMKLEDIVECNKPDTEGQTLCDPTHRRAPEESDLQRQEVDGGARAWGRGMGVSIQ